MALIKAEKSIEINTDKGKLHFSVFFIDEPIIVGERVIVTKWEDDTAWYPLAKWHSVFSYNNVNTSFTAEANNIKYENGYFDVFDEENNRLLHRGVGTSSNTAAIITYTFFIGSNGVPYVLDPVFVQNVTESDVVIQANTTGGFGLLDRVTWNVSAVNTGTITQARIDLAYAILNGSNWDKNDPFGDGGYSDTGGGGGDFNGDTDHVRHPTPPGLSAVDTGFITLFNPTTAQLQSLAQYMWDNPLFDLSNWKKLFADPMQAILGLSVVPVYVPSAGSTNVRVGNITTNVVMNLASTQYVTVNCGTINVNEYWGAYLDYSPYTKVEIYLPFIGMRPLNIDDIMGRAINLQYVIDILSGACVATLECDENVLYSFVGQCGASVPITGNDWTNVINGVMGVASSIGGLMMAGGTLSSLPIDKMTAGGILGTQISGVAGGLSNTAQNVNNSKPIPERSGAMAGMGGMLGIMTPYLILTRPRQCVPDYQNTYTGYPSFITRGLSQLSGFTIVNSIHLQNVPATDEELTEIETLLKTGVML